MSIKTSNCSVCKKQFTQPNKVGSPSKHCSDECKRQSRLNSLRKYADKTKVEEAKQCNICGISFTAKGRGSRGQLYCSSVCARRAENDQRNLQRMNNKQISTCPQCGKMFRNIGGRTYCSHECYLESKRPLEQTSACLICGQEFNQRGHKLKYCSSLCSTKAQAEVYRRNSTTRRALRVANGNVEMINPKEIFDRDGWRCQLCGKKVDKRLYKTKGTARHSNAPSLDHIIPISKGGEHNKANVQCACYLCNCKKGNKVIGQLRMFG
jgi:hypothetical protein